MNNKNVALITKVVGVVLFIILLIAMTKCSNNTDENESSQPTTVTATEASTNESANTTNSTASTNSTDSTYNTDSTNSTDSTDSDVVAYDFSSDYSWVDTSDNAIYAPSYYNGSAYIEVNDNKPYFTADEITTEEFETYSDLDSLGRCGVAFANISEYTMPDEERGDISKVKPSGWNNVKYDSSLVPGGYVYNRCHLIGYQLAGENDNDKNLITGTRYLNIDGMLDHENEIADYVRETGNHVMYRVTPVYEGDNLVADGVLMEAYSVEDNGAGVQFNIYAYNIQPGIEIDYSDGSNWQSDNDDVQVHFETNK